MVLGVGAGFPYPASESEFAAVGVPFAERFSRMLETIRIWRLVWEGGGASGFSGRYWSFSDLTELPRPLRAGGPPLWLAGGGPSALRLAGALFDGWLPYPPEPSQYAEGWSTVRTSAIGAQRDASALTGGLYITVLPSEHEGEVRAQLDEYTRSYYGAPIEYVEKLQAFVAGPSEHCLSRLREYVRAGAEHIVLRIGSLHTDRYFDAVARLAKQVAACR
jgi:alkanesulfonate monooxygenase SsuD/methylene tetrahydromethanopterin reductase-like flavin-dependent oxidoreductase (luciferase family)